MLCLPLMLLSVLPVLCRACPLSLHPPELEIELGEATLVNCSTPADGHRGIFWSYGNHTQANYADSYFVLHIPQINWDTQATCTIKLNDTYDCRKVLPIKVVKSPANVTVLSNKLAIEEKEHELKCEVNDLTLIQNLTVTWFINNRTMKIKNYDLKSSTNNISSILNLNVTRDSDGAIVTCEAMLDLGPHGPPVVSKDTMMLSVQYAPKFLDENENIHLKKSDNVGLYCEAMGNPSPQYNWTQDGKIVAVKTNYLNVSHVNETTTFICMASNYFGNNSKMFTLSVMEMTTEAPVTPKATDCPLTIIPNKIVVEYGHSASANCSTTVAGTKGIGWESPIGGTGLKPITTLVWMLEKAEVWDITAECFAILGNGLQCLKSLSITVFKTPDKVQVSPDGNSVMVEGKQHQLICEVFNVAPVQKVQVKWYKNNTLFYKNPEIQNVSASDETPQNVFSTMTLSPEKEDNGVNFTCEVELLLGQNEQNPKVTSEPYTAHVQYKPRIQDCDRIYTGKEDELMLDTVPCKADGNPEPVVHWYHNSMQVNSSKPLTRKDVGKYIATFGNIIGNSSTTVDITIEYGPSFSCKSDYNVTENHHLGSECKPEGNPKPTSVWFKDGTGEMAVLKLWKRHDSGKYRIEASNSLGNATHMLTINVLYPPEFAVGNSTREFSSGENLTLDCRAEGNPTPDLQWTYPPAANTKTDTRGRQLYVNVTGATSSNAGVYICGATNEVGSVTRSVTLIMKGKANSGNKIIWLLIFCIVVILLILGVLLYRNRRKKCGQYSVVSDSVPLTLRSSA